MYKKGFSLIELMLLMLIVAIALAASIPVITKKHLKLPQFSEHGVYLCYYDDDENLHEVRYTNKFGINKAVLDHTTSNCVFNPPAKASYFHISAVGGGGGGGDSGYKGGTVETNWTPTYNISPFNITADDLEAKGITTAEFNTYAGTLYAFARGTDSGRGGFVNYVYENKANTLNPSSSCSSQSTTPKKVCTTGPQFETRTEYGCKDNQTGTTVWSAIPINRDACIAGNNNRFTLTTRTREVKIADCNCTSGNCYNSPDSITSENICGNTNGAYIYNWQLASSTAGRARKGAYCVSDGVSGGVGLTYNKNINAWTNGVDGADMKEGGALSIPTTCSNASAGDGYVLCSDGTISKTCSDKNKATSSQFVISRNGVPVVSVKAYSAWKAGLGGRRVMDNENKYCNKPTATDSIPTATFVDKFGSLSDTNSTYLSKSSASGDGWCESGTLVARNYCNSIGEKNEAGYCLKRQNGALVPNGMYKYKYSYDQNYLTYGNPGNAGEYKSMVVRSFKNMDTTIRIGRGGAAGIKNSGSSGISGSATSMGNLIFASGGRGGQGGIAIQNEVLPKYNTAEYNNEVAIYNSCVNKKDICTPGNPSYNAENCSQLSTCNTKAYKYIRQAGKQEGLLPEIKDSTTNLFSYIIPSIKDAIATLFAKAGHGGNGGGVVHSCWAGQWVVNFEGHNLSSSVSPEQLPAGCYTNYNVTEATSGTNGALMIRW